MQMSNNECMNLYKMFMYVANISKTQVLDRRNDEK